MRYRASQIMYQINVIHMSLDVKPQHTIFTNIIFNMTLIREVKPQHTLMAAIFGTLHKK